MPAAWFTLASFPAHNLKLALVFMGVILGPICKSALIWPQAGRVLAMHCKALTVCASCDAKHFKALIACASGDAKHSCTSSSVKLHSVKSKKSASDLEQHSAAAR